MSLSDSPAEKPIRQSTEEPSKKVQNRVQNNSSRGEISIVGCFLAKGLTTLSRKLLASMPLQTPSAKTKKAAGPTSSDLRPIWLRR